MIRIGILGTGWVVRKHVEAVRLLTGLEIVAIASRDNARAQTAAAQFGIPRGLTGYETLVADPGIDLVVNALHNGLHCEWTVRALAAGKHVLCEKPLGCSSAEVEQMFAAARRADRLLLEGFMYRFHPQLPAILNTVRAGKIGRVVHIHSQRMSRGRDDKNPRYRREAGGGALLDIGCYCVNFARALAGSEPVRVSAVADFREGVDWTLAGLMEFGDHVTASFACSFDSEPAYAAEIFGTAGRIVVPHPWMPPAWPTSFSVVRAGKSEEFVVDPVGAPRNVLAGFALEYAHLADCIRSRRSPQWPGGADAETDSRGNMRAIEMLLDSARR